ncbi:unnamed protein product [Peronospora farinosa]|uniref:BZIP domain-containing protein n=1 Tax=Peronospora farinosa TaxID=134698 RepID=A0AAV0U6E4_9STRA|nr:unnamed protein product [Peronospora farinosa]CAI5732556.1 unnamed protein product [Peronospora farinosa]
MAELQPKIEIGAAPDLDAAEAERRRKQRDLKRKSRERKKRNIKELQKTAQVLELEYKQLFAAKLIREQQDKEQQGKQKKREDVAVNVECEAVEIEQSRLVELQEKYSTVRQEMHELREQMTGFKHKLEEYERFIAMLDGHLMGLQDTQTRQEEQRVEALSGTIRAKAMDVDKQNIKDRQASN